jgi:hypothetical protein
LTAHASCATLGPLGNPPPPKLPTLRELLDAVVLRVGHVSVP